MQIPLIVQKSDGYTLVEFTANSLLDAAQLEGIASSLYPLVDEQDRRVLVLDFSRVEFISSQAIGILMALQKKLAALKGGRLILCGVGPRLTELLAITKLNRLLTIRSSRREAVEEIEED